MSQQRGSLQQGVQWSGLRAAQLQPVGLCSRSFALGRLCAAAQASDESSNDGNEPAEQLGETLHAIYRIANDSSLSEVQRLQAIRKVMPAPLFPYETEPGMHGETLVAKSFGHLNDLLFLDSCETSFSKGSLKPSAVDRHRSVKLYRGMPDSDMHLLTSLQRLLGDKDGACTQCGATARALAFPAGDYRANGMINR